MTLVRVKALSQDNLSRIMEKICRAEAIEMTWDAKPFLLGVSNNSVRILINYLEKLKLVGAKSPLNSLWPYVQIFHSKSSQTM